LTRFKITHVPSFWDVLEHLPPDIDEDDFDFDRAIIGAYDLIEAEHREEHLALLRGKSCTT
jgi:hypothetical protein